MKYIKLLLLILIPMITYSQGEHVSLQELPSSFDCRDKGFITPVKDQGNFGTCWAFASVGLTEAFLKKQTGMILDLSEQQLISCADTEGPFAGMEYIEKNGLVLEADFPYKGEKVDCIDLEKINEKYKIHSYNSTVLQNNSLEERISLIKNTILNYGPVITAMNLMVDFIHYKGGIYVYDGHSEEQPGGHIVLIIGWHDNSDVENGGYWIIKNSAGEQWGENGYAKSAYGQAGIDDFYIIFNE
jgi:C1A family cysteine protease